MDSIEFKHLILDLKTTLNGDEEFFGSVRYLRYLSILAFASIAENFKEEGMNKNGILYFNLYTLQKIADFLGFKFDRTRSARTVLEDSVKRGESQKILDDKGVTHYSLTKNGLKSSQTRLLELYEITSSKLLPLAKKSSKERFTMKFMTSISHPSPSLHPEAQKLIDRMKSIERPLNII